VIQVSVISLQSSLVKHEFLETIKVVDGKALHLSYHQARYESVVNACSSRKLFSLETLLTNAPKVGLFRCRVLYGCDGVVSVRYHPYTKRSVTKLKLIEVPLTFEYAKKYANRRELDALYEQREPCDDVVIVQDGLIKDTTIANIALLREGVWYTPKSPLLKGTTRQRLLDEGKIEEAQIRVDELYEYESLALMNAMIDFDIIQNKSVEEVVC